MSQWEWHHNENRGCECRRRETCKWRHNENDVIMIIAGLWRYRDWRHEAMGCNALVIYNYICDTNIVHYSCPTHNPTMPVAKSMYDCLHLVAINHQQHIRGSAITKTLHDTPREVKFCQLLYEEHKQIACEPEIIFYWLTGFYSALQCSMLALQALY